jgi:hypothetical protein
MSMIGEIGISPRMLVELTSLQKSPAKLPKIQRLEEPVAKSKLQLQDQNMTMREVLGDSAVNLVSILETPTTTDSKLEEGRLILEEL